MRLSMYKVRYDKPIPPPPPPGLDPPACLWFFQIVSFIEVMNKNIIDDKHDKNLST